MSQVHVMNSNTFEERGFVMLEACEEARDAAFDKLASKARALRASYFAEMNKIAALAKARDAEKSMEIVDVG